MAQARLANPTGVFWQRSQPSNVSRVSSSIRTISADLRPRMGTSLFAMRINSARNALEHQEFRTPPVGCCTNTTALSVVMTMLES